MVMKRVFMSFSIMSIAVLSMSSALAADNGFYMGAGVGVNFFDSKDSQITVGNPGGYDAQNDDVAFRLFGGYQLNKWVGFEASYVDLGTQKISFVGIDRVNKMSVKGMNVSVVGTYPVTPTFDVFGKVGASYLKNTSYEYGADFLAMEGVPSAKNSDRKWAPSVGIGVRHAYSDNFSVRAEYDRLIAKSGQDTVEMVNNVVSVSAQYNF